VYTVRYLMTKQYFKYEYSRMPQQSVIVDQYYMSSIDRLVSEIETG